MPCHAVADPGFPRRGGGANFPKMGTKTYYVAKLFPKNAWKWKNLDQEGEGTCPPPL